MEAPARPKVELTYITHVGSSMDGFQCLGLEWGRLAWVEASPHSRFFDLVLASLFGSQVGQGLRIGFRVLALSHCTNGGSFSSIRMDIYAKNLY